ncbi:Kunitz-type trypsin inhibitor KTI1 [Spatholobus suberectus]|nr:Kunitz-type trypsin inhibitor KTI1 [Spatholobus suberectus]
MKVSLLALSIICFAFTIELFIGTTAAAPEPVLDTSGQKLRTGVKYYILPVTRGKDGGLTVSSTGNDTCPLFVVQEKFELLKGTPRMDEIIRQVVKWPYARYYRTTMAMSRCSGLVGLGGMVAGFMLFSECDGGRFDSSQWRVLRR